MGNHPHFILSGSLLKLVSCLIIILGFSFEAPAQNLAGQWEGSFEQGGTRVQLVMNLSIAGGRIQGTVDIPEQFEFAHPLENIMLEDSVLKFKAGAGSYEGRVSADRRIIEGSWSEGNEKQPLLWRRNGRESSALHLVVPQLKSLMALPAPEWRYHVGDIAHGENPDLDDTGWQLVKENTQGPVDAAWYRRSIEIPKNLGGYDLTGTRIWFQFRAYANGPIPQIIYFNGRRVAMGEDLEPIVLVDPAKAGEKVLVAVKLLPTVDHKYFAGADLHIDFSPERPNPADLFHELGMASLLASSLGKDRAAVERQVEAAAAELDLDAVHRGDQKAWDRSLEKARSQLEVARPKLQSTAIRLSGNAHIDAAWLWPWTETVEVVRHTFQTALQLMREYPNYTYTQSAAAYSEWICDKYPSECKEIADRVKQGRWELVGGMWVEPDLNMPDGESLVRQLLVGKRYFKEKFGVDVRIGWNPDSFGYNWQLPQIYKKSGIDYFITQKMAWNDTNQLPLKLFWWQSPDGSRVLTYFPHDYVNSIEPLTMAIDVAKGRPLNPGLPEIMHLYGIGDHGGGPTRAMLDRGLHWVNANMIAPPMSFGTAQGFFSDVEGKLDTEHSPVWNYKGMAQGAEQLLPPPEGKISLPIWNDELYFEYHRGVMTTQAQHKRSMRESEEQLLNAEKYSSLAWLAGVPYPGSQLAEAWKKVLFNQFHDLAAGSGIGVIYQEAQRDYDVVRWTAQDAISKALARIISDVKTTSTLGGVPVVVLNPLSWTRTDLVTMDVQLSDALRAGISVLDAEGRPLPMQVLAKDATATRYQLLVETKNMPALGYELLHVVSRSQPVSSDLQVHGLTLENALLRVVIDPKTGCMNSLYDKRSNFETMAAGLCGNELVAFKDTPKDYDAWNIDSDFENSFTNLDKVDSVQVIERGPLRATIRVRRSWQNSKFVQDISLYAGLDRVDVANDIDWGETHVLLKASFPLAASSAQATYEIPYGSIERPTTRNNSWERAKFEVPELRWADLGDGKHGLSLINESKYGYDAKGNVLRLSLLRSPTWPDPNADRGHHDFSYSLYPHAGDWKQALTVRRGYEFNYKLQARQVQPHPGHLPPQRSFVSVTPENVILTAMKKAEDSNGLILRFYEWAGKNAEVEINLPPGALAATVTNLMEQPEGSPLKLVNNRVTVPVHRYEIKSLRVDYAPPQMGTTGEPLN